ncbi:MAG: D-alanine--D-alanine ligase family protein [Bacillota bacterium]
MRRRTRVYLIFGGRSGEHEVSLMSARNILEAIDPEKYEVIPIGITKEGQWLRTRDPLRALMEGVEKAGGVRVGLVGDPTIRELMPLAPTGPAAPSPAGPGAPAAAPGLLEIAAPGDAGDDPPAVFFPVLHGPYGEDGTIQGLLEMAGVPYVGCGVLASAVGMDKAVAKVLFASAGLKVAPYLTVLRSRWEAEPEAVLAEVESRLTYPVFVKPANLGSSVGITKAKDREGLRQGLALAARFDRKILVEQGIDAREIEVAVLGNEEPFASVPGEIIPGREFYDYEDKYFDDKAQLLIPAPLTPEQTRAVREMAVTAFKAIDGAGMARVDFFLDRRTGEFYINEINTIPGFTRISMFPKLMEASGIPYPELIDRLIQLAIERWRDRQRNQVSL